MPDLPTITDARIADLLDRVPRSSFVDGGFLGGTPSLPVTDPATGRALVEVVDADAAAVGTKALDAAVAAQDAWARTLPRDRSDILRRAYELCHERADDLALAMTLEMGKPLAEAYGEVTYGAEFLRWFSEQAVRLPGGFRQAPSADQAILTVARPVGPVLAITPWNFPLSMGTRKIGPALAAGCAVVLKPASSTPLTSLLLMQVLADAGVPAGVVNCVVTSDSKGLSSTLLADPRLRKVSFTGSTPVGRTLLAQASEHVLRTSMELGGNAPFLVLPSADIDTAVAAAMPAKFRNNGEACTAANRFYVHASVAEQFTKALVEKASALQVGPGIDPSTTLGPLLDEGAVAKVEELVADAVERGARVLTGGRRPSAEELPDGCAEGTYYLPTVLGDVPADARVNREEIFGPVAPVIVLDDVDAMIAAANDTEFGLMSYVTGADLAEVTAAAQRIESGMVAVNLGVASDAAAPFGGIKESGLGREGAAEGLDEYLETTYVRLPL
ncbi:NAD-dependent succinate-semialdehyde dehydrogenase [Brachybacterium aquaticum]|uniref:Succinate-semialdehyde dehydrogenase/glutarate-semialdehyde dehydrogenase n=1 Tax=Brachybacterium aquaticum TaxID=1432564 RepID=A0A841AH46_9MICO|nr:NAD-dependent succinate-semialdehyde dehydrogenase [Brachybacterium aquaticum]MBB5832610.1 succinate-semialdehyde dehydrogenase/glutarate-semialdehyde dehydrogenase [Brachybacterium aquaticum]